MTKIDVYSGFLGAGKTTLIKKLIKEAYAGEKVVLIENEFGEIGVDGGFLKDSGVNITEMNSGCICCSLVGDFAKALKQVEEQYAPDRIIIEPSGVGKLSDVIRAVERANVENSVLNAFCAVVDANKCKMYMKNFGEFYDNQITSANAIILSRTGDMKEEKIAEAVALIREKNPEAVIVTTPWDMLDGKKILEVIDGAKLPAILAEEEHHHHHHDEDECDDPECECHHHHDDEEEHEHHHHHHDEDECDDPECECHHHHDDEDEHEHHHHHDEDECDDPECECHHHHDDEEHEHHHHHHHADDVFESIGAETAKKFTRDELKDILEKLSDEEAYGKVLRAKGIIASDTEKFIYFDFVPGESDIRDGEPEVIGRLCVIGSKINKNAISELFGVALKA